MSIDDWKAGDDQLGRFIVEYCVVADAFSGKARPLYECYRQWAEGADETPAARPARSAP